MYKNYKPVSGQKNVNANEQGGEPKKRMTRDERLAEIEKFRGIISKNEAETTQEAKDAWNFVLGMVMKGEACPLCTVKGHTLFKCPAYDAVRNVNKGMAIIKPIYSVLVAKEMLRIHLQALDNNNDPEGFNQPDMDDQ